MTDACALCGLPTPDPPVTEAGVDGAYCCRGCLEVDRTLGTVEGGRDEGADGPDRSVGDPESAPATAVEPPGEVAYLAVSGMHCTACERFLERTATREPGVRHAAASYPAGIVKVVYDPAQVDEASLADRLSGLGYRARGVDEAGDEEDETVGRLLVGGFFGMMVMVWYVLFLYPAYLGVDPGRLPLSVTGPAGRYLLGNVWVMATVVLGYTGFPILRGAYVSLRAGSPNMDLLVSLAAVTAYAYSVLALFLGRVEVYFDIAVVIVLAVSIGAHYEGRITRRAAGRLARLAEERADSARRRVGGVTDAGAGRAAATGDPGPGSGARGAARDEIEIEEVPIASLAPGDEVVVRTGERVPIDGTVVEGEAAVDRSIVTGESVPVRAGPGDAVLGGSMVVEGGLALAVDPGAESTIDRLARLLWDARSARSGATHLADRLAGVFVPLVIGLAVVATGVHLLLGADPAGALLTGLAVLVVSCPCALGLATPLAVASGVSTALREGIVVADGSAVERDADPDVVVFDKTGTLTTGRMRVEAVHGEGAAYAAAVEQFADHPVARAVVEHTPPPDGPVADFVRHPGRGASAVVDGTRVVVGRADLLRDEGLSIPDELAARAESAAGRIATFVGWDGAARGLIVAGDEPREGWEDAVAALASDRRVVVLTGDDEAAAAPFAAHPGVDRVFAGVPPEGKTAVVEQLRAEGTVAMVGDGVNDAPALAAADLGIAVAEGTRLAASAADAVIVTDDLAAVPRVFELTAATRRRVRENLGWAFCYNGIAVPLALLGLVNPLLAALAMTASSLLVVGNSARPIGRETDASAHGPEEPVGPAGRSGTEPT